MLVIADEPCVRLHKAFVENTTWKRLVIVVLYALNVHRGDSRLFCDFADGDASLFASGSKIFTEGFSHFGMLMLNLWIEQKVLKRTI